MMQLPRCFGIPVLLLAGCTPLTRQALPVLTPEDSIFRFLIQHDLEVNEEPFLRLIADSTVGLLTSPSDSTGLHIYAELLANVPPDLVTDFQSRVEDRVAINPEVVRPFVPTVRLFEMTETGGDEGDRYRLRGGTEITLREDTTGVYRTPDGVEVITRTFSRVGFDRTRRFALVHEYWQCGGRCGGTILILLVRGEDGRWEYRKGADGWIF